MLCVFMVEYMSVVVNVMLSLMSVMSPPPNLCNISVRTVVKLCTLGVLFWGEVGFLDCDDICMCVVNKHFELLDFFLNSVYVDLKYNEISLTFTCWVCELVWCVVCVVMWWYLVCL